MKFTKMKNTENNDRVLNTHCLCCVAAKIPFKLKQGEALLTFEDEDGMMHIYINININVFHFYSKEFVI